jgi:hypothetical protein
MNGYVPGFVKVTRNRVNPKGASRRPRRCCGAETMNPGCTLSEVELMVACRAPSRSTITLAAAHQQGVFRVKKAREQGDVGAQVNLAIAYKFGTGSASTAVNQLLLAQQTEHRHAAVHRPYVDFAIDDHGCSEVAG